MKFKVGDKVKIREDLEEGVMYGCEDVVPEMVERRGKIAEIVDVYNGRYKLDIDGEIWDWTDEMFELKPAPDEQPDDATTATVEQPDEPVLTRQDVFEAVWHSLEQLVVWSDDGYKPRKDSESVPDVRFPAFQADNVNHPQHYKHGEIETLDIIRMSLTTEEFQGFLKGNVLKYQLRAPFKHATPDEDYKKAKYYYDEYREVSE